MSQHNINLDVQHARHADESAAKHAFTRTVPWFSTTKSRSTRPAAISS
jgi:hypothetical protein